MSTDPEVLFRDLHAPLGKRAYIHKLTDTKEVTGLNKAKTALRTKKQPSDFLCCVDGETFLAEVKSSLEATSFPFSNIQTGQLAHAKMLMAAGGLYFFYIYRIATAEWFRVPAIAVFNHPRKSMRWDELTSYKLGPLT